MRHLFFSAVVLVLLLSGVEQAMSEVLFNDGGVHTISTDLGTLMDVDVFDGPGSSGTTVNVVPGASFDDLYVYESSMVNVSGGVFDELRSYDSTLVDISGGNFDLLAAAGSSQIDVTGGNFAEVWAHEASQWDIYGFNLALSSPTGGTLTGTLLDGTTVNVPVSLLHDAVINLHNIPEPSSLVLLSAGMLGLLVFTRRRRACR